MAFHRFLSIQTWYEEQLLNIDIEQFSPSKINLRRNLLCADHNQVCRKVTLLFHM